jgi:hypothetical protein
VTGGPRSFSLAIKKSLAFRLWFGGLGVFAGRPGGVFVIPYRGRANQTIMKKHLNVLTAGVLSLTLLGAHAQYGPRGGMGGGMGGAPSGPRLGGAMAKLFGDNSAFSATMEMHMSGGSDGGEVTMQGKIAFLDGKSRFEMDMSQMKNSKMTPQNAARMKQMGMDKIITISRGDKGTSYMVYPGLQAYVENTSQDSGDAKPASDFKIEVTEVGRESVDGRDCVKNKTVVTESNGKTHESIVWNASDLKKFPVKIVTGEEGKEMTMLFKNVQLGAPDAAQFDPPADFKKYDSMMSMMQQEMMKRAGAGRGIPPGQ